MEKSAYSKIKKPQLCETQFAGKFAYQNKSYNFS